MLGRELAEIDVVDDVDVEGPLDALFEHLQETGRDIDDVILVAPFAEQLQHHRCRAPAAGAYLHDIDRPRLRNEPGDQRLVGLPERGDVTPLVTWPLNDVGTGFVNGHSVPGVLGLESVVLLAPSCCVSSKSPPTSPGLFTDPDTTAAGPKTSRAGREAVMATDCYCRERMT